MSIISSPLFRWIKTFWHKQDVILSEKIIFDGVFLNEIFQQIDANVKNECIVFHVNSLNDRIKNWDTLLKNINNFYVTKLQQHIINLPNLIQICWQPTTDAARLELLKTLQLMISAACNCERRDDFVHEIQQLFIDPADALIIKEAIQEAMDEYHTVVAVATPMAQDLTSMQLHCSTLNAHLRTLLDQRVFTLEMMKELLLLTDSSTNPSPKAACACGGSAMPLADTSSSEKSPTHSAQLNVKGVNPAAAAIGLGVDEERRFNVELNKLKAENRKLRTELDDKRFDADELRERLTEELSAVKKLTSENAALKEEARGARALRDELDVVREKVLRVDRLEAEVERARDRQNQLEWLRNRLQTLEEDLCMVRQRNDILETQRTKLEAQLERVRELEKELLNEKQRNDDLVEQHQEDRERLEEVMAENERLQLEQRGLSDSVNLELEINRARFDSFNDTVRSNLDEQLTEKATSQVLRLQLENQRLLERLQEARESCMDSSGSAARVVELEKENRRLASKIDKLSSSATQEMQRMVGLETQAKNLLREKEQLRLTTETIRENCERQVHELEKENSLQAEAIEALRQRSIKSQDERVRELEKDNSRLHHASNELTAKSSKLEFEVKQLRRAQERSQESVLKLREVESANEQLTRHASDLSRQLDALKVTCEGYEELENNLSKLEVENQKLVKTLDNYKKSLAHKDRVEQENIGLRRENEKLARSNETLKHASGKILELEAEKEELQKRVESLEHAAKLAHTERERLEYLEREIESMEASNCKLQCQLDMTQKKVASIDRNLAEALEERQELKRQVDSSRSQARRLDDLEKEHFAVQLEQESLAQERVLLEKEVKRLHAALEEASEETRSLRQSAVLAAASALDQQRLIDAKQEARDLTRELSAQRNATLVLREELVQEKIKSQELANELDRMNVELDRVGLSRDKFQLSQQDHRGERVKALEELLEETVTQSVAVKEERIRALESRLGESVSRNAELSEELGRIRGQYEALKQRQEEESAAVARRTFSEISSMKKGSLTDNVVQLERRNAVLESENCSLREASSRIQSRLDQMEQRNASLQLQVQDVQRSSSELLQSNARLQVELSSEKVQHDATRNHLNSLLKETKEERSTAITELRQLSSSHGALLKDHEALQRLHDQLSGDYETLLTQLHQAKDSEKMSRDEAKSTLGRVNTLLREAESTRMLQEDQRNASLAAEKADRLRREREDLMAAKDKVEQDLRMLMQEYKTLKREHNDLQLKHTQQSGDLVECRDQLNTMDVEVAKMANKCEALTLLNGKLEDEIHTLMHQLQSLLSQNQELLTHTLENKDHFSVEERQLRDQLMALQRQKERLEDKIMDQYRRCPSPSKKSRGFGANLVRKAQRFMKKPATPVGGASAASAGLRKSESVDPLSNHDANVESFGKRAAKSTENIFLRNYDDDSLMDSQGLYTPESLASISSSATLPQQLNISSSRYYSPDNVEMDFSEPVPKLRQPVRRLEPGSMSIYDRSPAESPRPGVIGLHDFLLELNQKEKPTTNSSSGTEHHVRSKTPNWSSPQDGDSGFASEQLGFTRTQRPESAMASHTRRMLPTVPKQFMSNPSDASSHPTSAFRALSVPPERMQPATAAAAVERRHQLLAEGNTATSVPTPPQRGASRLSGSHLPSTERTERELSGSASDRGSLASGSGGSDHFPATAPPLPSAQYEGFSASRNILRNMMQSVAADSHHHSMAASKTNLRTTANSTPLFARTTTALTRSVTPGPAAVAQSAMGLTPSAGRCSTPVSVSSRQTPTLSTRSSTPAPAGTTIIGYIAPMATRRLQQMHHSDENHHTAALPVPPTRNESAVKAPVVPPKPPQRGTSAMERKVVANHVVKTWHDIGRL